MLLVDQVNLLRENLARLRYQQVLLPLMGGTLATRKTYQFKSLVHPARDIATTIALSDPQGDKLPPRLRGWNLDIRDEFGNTQIIHLKKLLSMIIHVYYLSIGNGNLDISNDFGKRVIVPYDAFLDSVRRLVLRPEEIGLVICGLTEENLKSRNASKALVNETPGVGDLVHFLATIKRWPELKESIWSLFFADQSSTVDPGCNTVNDVPFLKGSRHTGTSDLWHIGWRRNDSYAVSWIEISELIGRIREYFGTPRPSL